MRGCGGRKNFFSKKFFSPAPPLFKKLLKHFISKNKRFGGG